MYKELEAAINNIDEQTEKQLQNTITKLVKAFSLCVENEKTDCKKYSTLFDPLKQSLDQEKQGLYKCIDENQITSQQCIQTFQKKSLQIIFQQLSKIEKEVK
ncbi:unnamed protein product [Paramecium primaurelia]|uniref:Uncharacterized protein n=1 Tax=Paramecium primaurelia TaxID=5886 RepID=A0A8S1KDI5_PARPR|nr:unnamed protein product [Paramecium primaurelia]